MAKNTSKWTKTKHNFTNVWRTKLTNSSLSIIPYAKKKTSKSKIPKRMQQNQSLSDDEWIDITDCIESNESEELLHSLSKDSIEIPRDVRSLSNCENSFNEMIYNKSADIKFSTMLNNSNDQSFLPSLSLSPIDSIFTGNLQTEPVNSSVFQKPDFHRDEACKHVIKYVGSLNCTDISIKQVKSEGVLNIMDRHDVNLIPLVNKQQNLTSTPKKTNFDNINLDLSAIISDNSCPEVNTNISASEFFVDDKENDVRNDYKTDEIQPQNSYKQNLEEKENNKILTKTDHPYPICSIVATLLNQENKLSPTKKSNRCKNTSKPLSQYPVCSLVSLLQKK